ncbi:hypothetical protein BJV82DRAFT_575708 [Fennellomyces sp. T-0311]|nr:hypothetical protein BJV82DRAFT_575708 [Fennellomyces sp. T-0311]
MPIRVLWYSVILSHSSPPLCRSFESILSEFVVPDVYGGTFGEEMYDEGDNDEEEDAKYCYVEYGEGEKKKKIRIERYLGISTEEWLPSIQSSSSIAKSVARNKSLNPQLAL